MNAEPNLSFEALEKARLKQAMGTFATGVTVVSTHVDGIDYGMTCNSFNTVSLEPAMVLWSIAKSSGSHDAFINGGGYTVSVLPEGSQKTAMQFTRGAPQERYDGLATRRLESGRLILGDAVAWFDCTIDQIVPAGDHDVLIARVLEFQSTDREPMVYLKGQFTRAE